MKTGFLLPIMALASCMQISAQTIAPADRMQKDAIENTRYFLFGNEQYTDTASHRNLIQQFYEDQFRHAQDPRAPYFMLLSRSGSLAMGIGGDLKILGYYGWDGAIKGADFAPYNIPIPLDPAARSNMQMTPNHTSIFFSVFGNDRRFGNFQIYVQGKFTGAGNAFKLSKAYVTVGDWTLGQNKSSFTDPTAQASTVDPLGPNSEIDDSRLLLRYMHTVKEHFTYALSVEMPDNQIPGAAGLYKPMDNYIPDLAGFLQYKSGANHVRLGAIVKGLGYRDLVKGENIRTTGWGLNLATKFRPVLPLTVYAAVNYGHGIGSLVNDLSQGTNDLLAYAGSGRMYAPASYGWYAALQYNYSPSVFSTVIVSQERILPKKDSAYDGSQYKYGLQGTANVFWNITPRVQVGAEFNIGKRCNIDGTNRLGYRGCFVADFSF